MKRSLAGPAAAAALVLAALTACSTGSTDDTATDADVRTSADADAFPVTIEHAFGETTIEEEPTRVATLGWTDQDHALSLGVVPVGATKITWGGNEAGSTAWFDAEIEELGAEAPVRYDDTDGVPVDEVATTNPDLILATNSGLTEADYKKLSKIAPVVAFPEAPWTTSWQDSLELVGQALGRTELAEEVKAETESAIEAAREEYPELEGKELIYGYLTPTDLSQVGVYAPADPRVAILRDLGLVDAPVVDGIIEEGQFYGQISAEKAADLDSDVLITWVENPEDADVLRKNKLIGQIPAIKDGHFYAEADKEITMANTNPTPLSIPVIIEKILPNVAEAVAGS
jgi:iron complex transport system substrate-binding protein